MICMKELRFPSRPTAKVRHQGPPGSARAQPCLGHLTTTLELCNYGNLTRPDLKSSNTQGDLEVLDWYRRYLQSIISRNVACMFNIQNNANFTMSQWDNITVLIKMWKWGFHTHHCRSSTMQCSPYQVATGKIYRLKQHFLPPATAQRFTKIK